ncbi:MAG TPA: hypothetical protein VMQ81_06690 [Acidimicrobiia bacterium]|nr:hypothetical protein [Acidimicrobiia bacterium]
MTDRSKADDTRIESRAKGLTAEEQENGVDDAEALAEALLEESDQRADDRTLTPDRNLASDTGVEHRRSEDTVDLTE